MNTTKITKKSQSLVSEHKAALLGRHPTLTVIQKLELIVLGEIFPFSLQGLIHGIEKYQSPFFSQGMGGNLKQSVY